MLDLLSLGAAMGMQEELAKNSTGTVAYTETQVEEGVMTQVHEEYVLEKMKLQPIMVQLGAIEKGVDRVFFHAASDDKDYNEVVMGNEFLIRSDRSDMFIKGRIGYSDLEL